MTTTWLCVAHRGGARVIESSGRGAALKTLFTLDHPEGRLREQDLETDAPGTAFESASPGQRAMQRQQQATEHVAETFAKNISDLLERGRQTGSYDQLVLVAPPRFLGRLRDALSPGVQATVVASVDKDLPDTKPEAIRQLIAETILV
jgi:protein required for attachment to host cells